MKRDWNLTPGVSAEDIDPPEKCPECGGPLHAGWDECFDCGWIRGPKIEAPEETIGEKPES